MKHRTPRFIAALTSISALLLTPFFVFAAASPFPDAPFEPFVPKPGDPPPVEKPADSGLKSCFDYYRFGSTPIVLSSELTRVAQGSQIAFTGRITNENAYPLSDLAVYAKVFHRRNPAIKDSFGPDVVDWFLIQDKLNLDAGQTVPLTFAWNAPIDATPGQYAIATFVLSHDRFNMAGLSFTTDVVGTSYEFSVDGGMTGNTQFDITKTTVGTQVLHAAAFSPRFQTGENQTSIPVVLHLKNTSGNHFSGRIKWALYSWDRNLESNLIERKEQDVSVDGFGTLAVPYDVEGSGRTVYNLVAELIPANPAQTKSIVSVRYVTDESTVPRLNFVGATKYPADAATEAIACVHSTGMKAAPNTKLELVARSNNFLDMLTGKAVLAKAMFEGSAPGSISALAAPFARASDSFTVSAKLYQDGTLIDSVDIPYCMGGCSASSGPGFSTLIVQVVVFIFMTMGILALLHNKKQAMPPAPTQPKV